MDARNVSIPHQLEVGAYLPIKDRIWLCRQASNEIREAVAGGSSLDGAGAAEGSRRHESGVDAGNL